MMEMSASLHELNYQVKIEPVLALFEGSHRSLTANRLVAKETSRPQDRPLRQVARSK